MLVIAMGKQIRRPRPPFRGLTRVVFLASLESFTNRRLFRPRLSYAVKYSPSFVLRLYVRRVNSTHAHSRTVSRRHFTRFTWLPQKDISTFRSSGLTTFSLFRERFRLELTLRRISPVMRFVQKWCNIRPSPERLSDGPMSVRAAIVPHPQRWFLIWRRTVTKYFGKGHDERVDESTLQLRDSV